MTDEKVDAWMPLWIGAYLADTMTLTTQQHGAYLLLLFAYWRNRGPLTDDDEDLASIVKASPAEWKKLRTKLARFFTIENGTWAHGRADKELAIAGIRKANAVSKAKAGADARWKKGKKDASGDAPSMPEEAPGAQVEALHGQCPTPSPTPSPSESSVPNGTGAADAPPAVDKSPEAESQKRQAWRECGNWFVANGVAEGTAREVIGKVARDFPAVAIDACLAAAKNADCPDPEAYLIATAKRMAGELRTVPSAEAAKTAEYLHQSAEQKAAALAPESHEARRAAMAKLGRTDAAGHSPRAAA